MEKILDNSSVPTELPRCPQKYPQYCKSGLWSKRSHLIPPHLLNCPDTYKKPAVLHQGSKNAYIPLHLHHSFVTRGIKTTTKHYRLHTCTCMYAHMKHTSAMQCIRTYTHKHTCTHTHIHTHTHTEWSRPPQCSWRERLSADPGEAWPGWWWLPALQAVLHTLRGTEPHPSPPPGPPPPSQRNDQSRGTWPSHGESAKLLSCLSLSLKLEII